MGLRRRSFQHDGLSFVVDRGVFDSARHLSGVAMAENLAAYIDGGERVLDLGTGCGLLAITAARFGAAAVVATDIDQRAARCAQGNIEAAGLTDVIEVRCGDLFEPVAGDRFGLVVCNPPYEVGNGYDPAFGSPDFLRRLAAQASSYTDRLVVGYPADEANELEAAGLVVELSRRVSTAGDDLGIFVS